MDRIYTYEEVDRYISDIPRFTKKTKVDNTKILLEKLGNPQKKYKSVHIAGTNGKGSVAKMMSLLIEKSGKKTGLFTSPHLIKINERFCINGIDISDERLVELFNRVMEAVEECTIELKEVESSDDGNIWVFQHPAYFEFIFCMAALYFAEEGCDYVVYETGLGGRLDATNVIEPEVSIITSIGFDHMQYLGNTIEEIAGEKAGIIKQGIPVVYNTGDEKADKVIEKKAEQMGSDYFNVPEVWEGISDDLKDSIMSYVNVSVPYQIENVHTAVIAWMVMQGVIDKNGALQDMVSEMSFSGLSSFYWPGRMEYILPNVVIDGAHNEDAIREFIKAIKREQDEKNKTKFSLMFAVSSDKDYESIIRMLCDGLNLEKIYVTEIASDRKTDVADVVELFLKYLPKENQLNVVGNSDLKKSFEMAIGETDEDTLLAIVGSLYMVGEVKALLENKVNENN
ncbi:MAG: bifunctional folylpolyglutamate synthase/dihydrofolate synthase [Eubacterium sp.]|nr:bifunctional folylpolyglutamate synthase/dihydrofolate synthase [Eubacterium sp.]